MLAVGFASALVIYFTAEDEPETGVGYVIVNGGVYVIPYSASRTYVRDLERFGGKAAVLFDELNRWFAARWHGRALGITVAWIAIALAALLYWISGKSPSR